VDATFAAFGIDGIHGVDGAMKVSARSLGTDFACCSVSTHCVQFVRRKRLTAADKQPPWSAFWLVMGRRRLE
jgi:hypothetical protein